MVSEDVKHRVYLLTLSAKKTMSGQENGSESPLPQKSTRFGKRKQLKRGKRTRSDGFVLGVEIPVNSEDELDQVGHEHRKGSLGPDPEALNFLIWIRNPTVQNLAKLRKAIKSNDSDWMQVPGVRRPWAAVSVPEELEQLPLESPDGHGAAHGVCQLHPRGGQLPERPGLPAEDEGAEGQPVRQAVRCG